MAFCQRVFNRVFQPPPELRQGGIPSRGRKQGCFQPGPPAGPGQPSGLRDHAAGPVVQQRHGAAGPAHPPHPHPGDERRQQALGYRTPAEVFHGDGNTPAEESKTWEGPPEHLHSKDAGLGPFLSLSLALFCPGTTYFATVDRIHIRLVGARMAIDMTTLCTYSPHWRDMQWWIHRLQARL